jgi:hypothetical protein
MTRRGDRPAAMCWEMLSRSLVDVLLLPDRPSGPNDVLLLPGRVSDPNDVLLLRDRASALTICSCGDPGLRSRCVPVLRLRGGGAPMYRCPAPPPPYVSRHRSVSCAACSYGLRLRERRPARARNVLLFSGPIVPGAPRRGGNPDGSPHQYHLRFEVPGTRDHPGEVGARRDIVAPRVAAVPHDRVVAGVHLIVDQHDHLTP